MSDRNVFGVLPATNASLPEEEPRDGSVLVLATRVAPFTPTPSRGC